MNESNRFDFLFLLGLLLLSWQETVVGPAQLGHLWMLGAFSFLFFKGEIKAEVPETLWFLLFLSIALANTFLVEDLRIKYADQILKFCFVYPAFYLIGRAYGRRYSLSVVPLSYGILAGYLLFQYLVQAFRIPFLYINFESVGLGALNGTFKERNWMSIFFFFLSYVLILKSDRNLRAILLFVGLNVAVAFLGQSKSVLPIVAVVILLQVQGRWPAKILTLAAGTFFYLTYFSNELSTEALQARMDTERGAAFDASLPLLIEHPLGYGFGFVEAYFTTYFHPVAGLGEGVNSIFSTPLDLMLIAGVAGLLFWGVFFSGIGLGAFSLLVPVALWSLLNPLHQSVNVYLFVGLLVSFGQAGKLEVNPVHAFSLMPWKKKALLP